VVTHKIEALAMRTHRLIAVVLIVIVVLGARITPTHAGSPYSALYAFGDSLSDVGNDFILSNGTEPAPPYYQGRYSNGPVWLDYLATQLNTGAMNPSVAGGKDYAFGGATTGYGPTLSSQSLVPTFQQQVALFNAATHGVAPSTALYAVWIGGEDLLNVLQNVLQSGATVASALGMMRGAAATEANVIATLIGQGARYILVGLVPDAGKSPTITVLGPTASATATALAAAYNIALVANLSAVIASSGAKLVYLDAFSLVDVLVADPGAFGLSNVTQPCYVGPLTGGGTVCAAPDKYLFWDEFNHPTTAGHAIVADEAADVLHLERSRYVAP
jgi:phospholipase/lecithinase/hemolysin